MIYTKYRTQLLLDMVEEVRKAILEQPTRDSVIEVANEDMTLDECYCIVEYFQRKGFETTWYHNSKGTPIIVVSWGILEENDWMNNRYKEAIEKVGKDAEMIQKLVAEYLSLVYSYSGKNICVIPAKYLEDICGSHIKCFDYMMFRRTLHYLEHYYSLKADQYAFDDNSWAVDYISIQKKEKEWAS